MKPQLMILISASSTEVKSATPLWVNHAREQLAEIVKGCVVIHNLVLTVSQQFV